MSSPDNKVTWSLTFQRIWDSFLYFLTPENHFYSLWHVTDMKPAETQPDNIFTHMFLIHSYVSFMHFVILFLQSLSNHNQHEYISSQWCSLSVLSQFLLAVLEVLGILAVLEDPRGTGETDGLKNLSLIRSKSSSSSSAVLPASLSVLETLPVLGYPDEQSSHQKTNTEHLRTQPQGSPQPLKPLQNHPQSSLIRRTRCYLFST